MDKDNEQLSIQVRNQVIQERSLIKAEGHIPFVFKTILTCFASSLFIQVVTLIPSSYQLINQLPVIITLLIIGVSLTLFFVNKAPTIKTYLLVISIVIGLLIGM